MSSSPADVPAARHAQPAQPALPGLPGASTDAGHGPAEPALLDGVIAEATPDLVLEQPPAPAAVEAAVSSHLARLAGPERDLFACLMAAPARVPAIQEALGAGRAGVRVALTAGAAGPTPWSGAADPSTDLRRARHLLLDDDRVELIGVHLPLPAPDGPRSLEGPRAAALAAALLGDLDSIVPAWIEVPPAATAALDVIADDGAEEVALRVGDDDGHAGGIPSEAEVAVLVRRCVDLDLTVHAVGGVRDAVRTTDPLTGAERHGLLNLLCAVRAALNGASTQEIAAVLAERRPSVLASAARRMSQADAAVARAFLVTVAVSDPATVLEDLRVLGLLAP
ncbi:MAG: hypothetical protein U0Q15_19680 [Kineosporiaceae bacterium]